mgnify:FL=1
MKSEISIVIPNFNRNKLFIKTLDSIRSQSINNWRCIIVDDGSEEETLNALKKYIQNDSRFELFSRDREPKGANTCRNIGLSQVKTDWVMFFDSDDIMLPTCLMNRTKAIEENQDYDLLLSQGVTFSSKGIMNFRNNPLSQDYLKEIVGFNVALSTPTAIWKTSFIKKIRWNENIQRWQDCELFIRVLQFGAKYKWISLKPDHLIRSEGHNNRITNSKSKYNDIESLAKIFSEVYLTLNEPNNFYFARSIYYYFLKSSYFISSKQNTSILNIIKEKKMLTKFNFYKLKFFMTLNSRYNKVKYIKGVLHLFISNELKKYNYNAFYRNDELLEWVKKNIKIENYIS